MLAPPAPRTTRVDYVYAAEIVLQTRPLLHPRRIPGALPRVLPTATVSTPLVQQIARQK